MTELTVDQAYALQNGLRRGPRGWETTEGELVTIHNEPAYDTFRAAYEGVTPRVDDLPQDEDRRR